MSRFEDEETKADLNALKIYLGLDHPKDEAMQIFMNIWHKKIDVNSERYKILQKYIDEFDQKQQNEK